MRYKGCLSVIESLSLQKDTPFQIEFRFAEGHRGSWAKALIDQKRHPNVIAALTQALGRNVGMWRDVEVTQEAADNDNACIGEAAA